MAGWTDCRRFDQFEWDENKEILVGRAGVYQFGFFYAEEFKPKYIGRVVWTPSGWDFYKRFNAYKNNPHNEEIGRRVRHYRNTLWFRVMVVSDPAWTESKYLLDDLNQYGQFEVFEWNGAISRYAETYYKHDWQSEYSDAYT